jgi:hypothetical protein
LLYPQGVDENYVNRLPGSSAAPYVE